MAKWQADKIPEYNLSIKYLRMIMSKTELDQMIKRYVEAKKTHLSKKHARTESATDPATTR